jgi:mannose-6-phosphate isomerase-like protein (cupin superfamily)
MGRPIRWTEHPAIWTGEYEGASHGSGASIIFVRLEPGRPGPRLHMHPYPETFVVRRGQVDFTVGDEQVAAAAGDIVVVPADTPHRFDNGGDDLLEMMDIHPNERFATIWLEK